VKVRKQKNKQGLFLFILFGMNESS